MTNGIKNKRLYNFIIIWLALLVGVSVLVFTSAKTPLKAETNIYTDLNFYKDNYCLDYTTPENYSGNGITITNNLDGTFTIDGTTSAVTYYEIPINIPDNLSYCYDIAPNNTNSVVYTSCCLLVQIFCYDVTNSHLYGGYNDYPPAISMRVASKDGWYSKTNLGRWGSDPNSTILVPIKIESQSGGANPSIGYEKKAQIYIGQNVTFNNLLILPIVINNGNFSDANNTYAGRNARAIFEYFNYVVGPTANTDVYYASTKPQAGYYIYQKANAQFGVDLLPAIRYTLTADTTEITKDSALTLESANIDVLKLTAPNGNIYRVYYDNITASNTKDSYFVDDNGTTTILQNADGSGLINSTGLDALILAFQHALTYNAVITTANHYIFNLCSYLYVFDTDFGYAKGVQEGSANYQPGQPGYTSIYDAGVDYGEQQKDIYYNNYYGGSDGVGGAGYTSIYNAGVEAGADISVNWVFKCMSAVGSFLSIEILPNITFGALIGIPFIITLAWFIIRQLRGGGGS